MEKRFQFRFDRSTDNAIKKIVAHLAQEGLDTTVSNAIRFALHKTARKLPAAPTAPAEVA